MSVRIQAVNRNEEDQLLMSEWSPIEVSPCPSSGMDNVEIQVVTWVKFKKRVRPTPPVHVSVPAHWNDDDYRIRGPFVSKVVPAKWNRLRSPDGSSNVIRIKNNIVIDDDGDDDFDDVHQDPPFLPPPPPPPPRLYPVFLPWHAPPVMYPAPPTALVPFYRAQRSDDGH